MHPILHIAAYQFAPLDALKQRRAELLALCKGWKLQGAIVLSPEGINLRLAGAAPQVEQLLQRLRSWPGLQDLQPRIRGSEQPPYQRMAVRIKQELIALGDTTIAAAQHPAALLLPSELAGWLDDARCLTLLDVRNDAEVRRGSFETALNLGIAQFRELPAALAKLDAALKQRPLVVFCTNGMRSAKAGPLLERAGFRHIRQLAGGICDYLVSCGRRHFRGECVLLDQHSALDPALPAERWQQCANCRTPLNAADQTHPDHQPGVCCKYCFQAPPQRMAPLLAQRHTQLQRHIVPLPGSRATDHFRPLRVPAACDGLTLLETLCRVVPHISAATWQQRCTEGYLVNEDGMPCTAQHGVRGGECYRHKFPGHIEPDVNMQIALLYEDPALLVLNKPAPLPMHAGGRFHHNTLKYVLDALYHPEQPLPAHRLDANTTGIVVAARTQYLAGKLQPQFARGEVEKLYLVRVMGRPQAEQFDCDAPISVAAGELGTRSIDARGGLPSLTRFRVLQHETSTTLLEARPLTGRTNQIRVHLWHLGLPVCGDPAYLSGQLLGGSQTLPITAPPLCLHAWRISFQHPLHGRTMTFTAPAPQWLQPSAAPQ